MPLLARKLRIDEPVSASPPVTLELTSLRDVEGDIVDYTVNAGSRAAGRLVRELALPEGVVIAMITRGQEIIPPHGSTRIEAGDHVIVVLRLETRAMVNNVFGQRSIEHESIPAAMEFPLRPNVTVGELESFYGVTMNADPSRTLDEFLRDRLPARALKVGSSVDCGLIRLSILGLNSDGTIERVGMLILPWVSHSHVDPQEQSD